MALGAVVLLSLPSTACAYLDPTTGSMLLQVAVGGILGAMFALKMYWQRVTAFLSAMVGRSRGGPPVPPAA